MENKNYYLKTKRTIYKIADNVSLIKEVYENGNVKYLISIDKIESLIPFAFYYKVLNNTVYDYQECYRYESYDIFGNTVVTYDTK